MSLSSESIAAAGCFGTLNFCPRAKKSRNSADTGRFTARPQAWPSNLILPGTRVQQGHGEQRGSSHPFPTEVAFNTISPTVVPSL